MPVKPDPTFYPSPASAIEGPPEELAYVVTLNTSGEDHAPAKPDALTVIDVKDGPRNPKLVKVVEADELAKRTGYSRPHTVHCGPDGLYVSALGNPAGDGPGGVLLLDHDDFSPLGQWEIDRGPQQLAYDVWWNIGYDTLLTSEWGTPNMVEDGLQAELLLGGKYGHHL